MWPSLSEFSEAIQNPSFCFPEANLKSGVIAVDRLGMPLVSSGQFAGVFKLHSSNRNNAIRCFIRELGDRAKRYNAIDSHLDKCQSIPGINCLANFDYDPGGILVKGKAYPILVMEWIQGNTLDVYVEQVVGNKEALFYLANEFLRLIKILKEVQIAHGDLQHGNIIVQQDLHLRLVDFDGMYVPEMNGMNACELGHLDYQHPLRDTSYFNPNLDNFSALSIYISLMALAYQPSLWKQFHGEGLLLKNRDFKNPRNSNFFSSVNGQSQELKKLLDIFRESCEKPPSSTPSLTDLVKGGEERHLPAWMLAPAGAAVETKSREVRPEEVQPAVTQTSGRTSQRSGSLSRPSTVTQSSRSPSTTPATPLPFGFFTTFIGNLFVLFWPWLIVSAIGAFNPGWALFCAVICGIIAFNKTSSAAQQQKSHPPQPYKIPTSGGGTISRPQTSYPTTPPSQPSTSYPTSGQAAIVIGSNIRFIYHRPSCEWAIKISSRNEMKFRSAHEAQVRGYRPCRVCHP